MGRLYKRGLAIILVFQLAGEALVRVTGIPFPAGARLIYCGSAFKRLGSSKVGAAADFLLQNLTLFFTPVVVGAVVYRELLAANWFAIGLALLVSTAAGLLVTGKAAQYLEKAGSDESCRGPVS